MAGARERASDGDGKGSTPPKVPPKLEPGHILPVLQGEIDGFEEEVQRFRAGEVAAAQFRGFRLQLGIYGQRQPDNQMVRVKLPFGGISADQMETLGQIAEKFSGLKRGHITTRENFQFHFVNLDDVPEIMRLLAAVGLTTREACGHTVRNVTGCAYGGVCPREVFDATPYLVAYARNMLRNPICQRLPRKFKTAFSSCADDCAGTPFHDLGFVAKVRSNGNGSRELGFEIRVGGGLSTMPRQADVLYDFVPVAGGEYIRLSEAILRVFDKEGGMPGFLRKNLLKARIKFLLNKIGPDEFRRQVEEELRGDWAREAIDLDALMALPSEGPNGYVPLTSHPPLPPGYQRWRETNVRPQSQAGYCAVTVTVPQGNISAPQFADLTRITRTYCSSHARTNQNQNLVLRWVPEAALPQLHAELVAIGLGDSEAGLIADIVSCPGTDSCSLGITSSMGMARALSQAIRDKKPDNDALIDAISIKINACPNSCGQHHVGGIGLQGAAMRIGEREVPAYEVYLGGGNYIGGARYGHRVTRIPAKRVPQAVARILDVYRQERRDGEGFEDFIDRFGAKNFQPLLGEFKEVGPVHKDVQAYLDWGSELLFSVTRGEGECAAGQ